MRVRKFMRKVSTKQCFTSECEAALYSASSAVRPESGFLQHSTERQAGTHEEPSQSIGWQLTESQLNADGRAEGKPTTRSALTVRELRQQECTRAFRLYEREFDTRKTGVSTVVMSRGNRSRGNGNYIAFEYDPCNNHRSGLW